MRWSLNEKGGDQAAYELGRVAQRVKDAGPVLKDLGEHLLYTSIPENFRAGGRPDRWPKSAWTSEKIQQDSGRLLRSIQYKVNGRKLEVGTNLKYAAQRHFGGVLKPVRAKALAIPLPGTPRTMARPGRWGDRLFFLAKVKGDKNTIGVLATKIGKKKIKPLFVLRASVKQPPRPFILMQGEDIAWFSGRLGRWLAEGA